MRVEYLVSSVASERTKHVADAGLGMAGLALAIHILIHHLVSSLFFVIRVLRIGLFQLLQFQTNVDAKGRRE
jgi:hypothetical protein